MMLRYSLHDAECWAAFSGDYNPIHFDRERAAQLGSDELSVHGMRAMLDLKHFLSQAAQSSDTLNGTEHLTFTARLRRPLWCNHAYALSLLPNKRPQRISAVLTDQAGEPCFDGRLDSAQPPVMEQIDQAHTISANQWQSLNTLFPRPDALFSQWVFLDAALFQFLVKAPETFQMIRESFPDLPGESVLDIFTQVAVIQTHHETCFHSGLLLPHAAAWPQQNLHYAVQPPLITGDRESGALLRIGIQAWNDMQPLMSTALTLKAWPPASQTR